LGITLEIARTSLLMGMETVQNPRNPRQAGAPLLQSLANPKPRPKINLSGTGVLTARNGVLDMVPQRTTTISNQKKQATERKDPKLISPRLVNCWVVALFQ
jgi:hypothetical protein